jgi:O-antigen ligase
MLHSIGLAATLGMALMPMFRSVLLTLLIVLIIDTFWEKRTTRRAWRVALICVSVGLIFIATLFIPESVVEDRSRAENVYGRVAQFEQTLRVFLEHPVLGVGFYNFGRVVAGEPRYVASYQGVNSVDSPHNNLTQVLAETGIVGFLPYMIAHILLLRAMWQLRQLSSLGRLAWKYYVYLWLTYWITGLTESSGYSPLNLVYIFATTVFFKYAITDPDLIRSEAVQVPDKIFSEPAHVF